VYQPPTATPTASSFNGSVIDESPLVPPPTEKEVKALNLAAKQKEKQIAYVGEGIKVNMDKLKQINEVSFLSLHIKNST
jgi:hypothetical protein